jgi:hypothetical protein
MKYSGGDQTGRMADREAAKQSQNRLDGILAAQQTLADP